MARRPRIPPALTDGPFTLDSARAAGLSADQLKGRAWRRLAPRTYVLTGTPVDPRLELAAAIRRLPASAAFSGLTAAWLHGLDAAPSSPIEVVLPADAGVSGRAGLAVHRAALEPDEVVVRQGLRATSIARTLADVARYRPVLESVVLIDSALRRRLLTLADLDGWLSSHDRWPGTARLRRAIQLADPKSESPMESRLRLLLVLNGLPPPLSQVKLKDPAGRVVARADLFYPEARLVIEHDGGVHRDQLTADNRRQNQVLNAGYRMLRFSAPDVLGQPASVVATVRAALDLAA